MSANDKQVGGSHYAAALQHWDVCEENGIGYLESAATKYVSRWRKKNGVQDLEKALHYTEKLLEMNDVLRAGNKRRFPRGTVPTNVVLQFASANDLEAQEIAILFSLWQWKDALDLSRAVGLIQDLLKEATNATSRSSEAQHG